MSKINSLLSSRLKAAGDKLSKMTELAELSGEGGLSSFAGVFRVAPLTLADRETLSLLLTSYQTSTETLPIDLERLSEITAEVRAIQAQAAILHGERIKRAQEILKSYRDGAFSAWLVAAYGNRQTPYNFLQYYELHQQLSKELLPRLEAMPRQAVYTLASRDAPLAEKEELIRNYRGEPKQELLSLIRQKFPLADGDKRAEDATEQAISFLRQALSKVRTQAFQPKPDQAETLRRLLHELASHVE
jgi:hypothetical protein